MEQHNFETYLQRDIETIKVKIDNLAEVKTELKDIKSDMDKITGIMGSLAKTLSSIDDTLKTYGERGFIILKYLMAGVFIIVLVAMGIENLETLKLLK